MPRGTYHASVTGSSHEKTGGECQDFSLYSRCEDKSGKPVEICVIADGAGSCRYGGEGARFVCESMLQAMVDVLPDRGVEGLDKTIILDYISNIILGDLEEKAQQKYQDTGESTAIKDFSCTLLMALLADDYAVFCQIGDGGMVIKQEEEWRLVFKGEKGEYANQTFFITSDNLEKHFSFDASETLISDLIMFTDGIENIVVNAANGEVSNIFFDKLRSGACRAAPNGSEYLEKMLSSDIINERTDDDKTILISMLAEDNSLDFHEKLPQQH